MSADAAPAAASGWKGHPVLAWPRQAGPRLSCTTADSVSPRPTAAMPSTPHTIQCRCGQLQGVLSSRARFTRLSCYCSDCQAYARALGDAGQTLDALGGTDIVATLQQHVSFTQGADVLACMSLSDNGLLRWYASCCNTPIGNTARNPKLSYVGLVHTCLGVSSASLDEAFGAERVVIHTQHAQGSLKANAFGVLVSTVRIIRMVLWARLSGGWTRGPFFRSADFAPVASPRGLTDVAPHRGFPLSRE
ncbi:MAG: DUF6151 family protein [Rhizobacter sp.]